MSTAAGMGDHQGENVRNDAMALERVEDALAQSEAKYRSLFESIDEGFCVIEMLFDARGKPVDYRFLEVNAAFERQVRAASTPRRCSAPCESSFRGTTSTGSRSTGASP